MVSEPPAPGSEDSPTVGEGQGEREETDLVVEAETEEVSPAWINYLEAQSQAALEQSRNSLEQTREMVGAATAVFGQLIDLRKNEAAMEHAEAMASLNIEAKAKGQDVDDRRHNNRLVSSVAIFIMALVGLAYLWKGDAAFAEKIITLFVGYVAGHGHAVMLQKKADDKKASEAAKP